MAPTDHSHRPIVVVEAPAHPVTQLQGPFEESMLESQCGQLEDTDIPLDATSRRTMLLEAPTYQRVIAGRWKQRHGEKYHPLWKLVAQMSFGIHLLAESMARSQEDVFQILQTHVDDIDVFLERTTEDFTLAKEDIQERLKCLELPLQHPEVFDRMLEDRAFRNNIVEGNEKIEHIINRTGCAMKDALKDVQKGFDSTSCLERYLHTLDITWARATPEHEAVFFAMLGNVEGWKKAFMDLHQSGHKLASLLRKLTDVVNQMQQRAGEVSRRLISRQQRPGANVKASNGITYVSQQQPSSRSSSRQQPTPPPSSRQIARKPLPSTSATGERHHTRTRSREQPQTQRVGTSQSQYSVVSQGTSTGSRAETPVSRAQSRNELAMSPTREQESVGNVGGPRLVQVKNRSEHTRTRSRTESSQTPPPNVQGTLKEQRSMDLSQISLNRPQVRRQGTSNISATTVDSSIAMPQPTRVFAPVELPAELPPSAFLQAPMSSTNRMSTGLGILPSAKRAQSQSKAYNPTTALIELLSDPSRYSRLPLTPDSPQSPSNSTEPFNDQLKLTAQAQRAILREPTPDQTPPKDTNAETSTVPSSITHEATRATRTTARGQSMFEKIPYHMDSAQDMLIDNPLPGLASTAKLSHPKVQTLFTEHVTSANSEKSGSEFSATDTAPSELSAGYEDQMPTLSHHVAVERAMLISTPDNEVAKKKKKLSFIAELEGSEPVFLPSTVYTPTSALSTVPDITATYELEAPLSYFSLPPRIQPQTNSQESASELSANEEVTKDKLAVDPAADTTEMISITIEEAFDDKHVPSNERSDDRSNRDELSDKAGAPINLQAGTGTTAQYRLSANIETADDLIHEPAYVPPESPEKKRTARDTSKNTVVIAKTNGTSSLVITKKDIVEPTPISTETKIPSGLVDSEPSTIPETTKTLLDTEVKTSTGLETIPENSSAVASASVPAAGSKMTMEEKKVVAPEEDRSATIQIAIATEILTAKRYEASIPLKLETAQVVKPSSEDAKATKSPDTPSATELIRSNTRDSRQKWKAFFGQRNRGSNASVKSSSSSIRSRDDGGLASPTLSVQESLKTPIVTITNEHGVLDIYDAVSMHSKNNSVSTMTQTAGIIGRNQQNATSDEAVAELEDHHSIFDDYA